MPITEEQFQAFLHCETKAYLKSIGTVAPPHEYADWRRRTEADYEQQCLAQLRSGVRAEDCFTGTLSPQELKARKYRFVLDCVLQAQEFSSRIQALERVDNAKNAKLSPYIPIRFIPNEKITSFDKLLLAYDGLVLSAVTREKPPFGKIIHGKKQSVTKINLPDWMDKAKAIVAKLSAKLASATPPPLILNRHCAECEYKTRCRQIAVEKDDLSLLSGMTEKEWKKQRSKGIFTVTQLSYTYRPRRRPKRLAAKPDNYSHALRALALRENKIHIAGSPKLNITGTPVYLDVEGVPDRDFYYLIGMRFKSGEADVQHSFWANDESEEKDIWASFLKTLAQIENPQLVHYGSYEITFLKQMKQRYGNGDESAIALDQLIKDAINVLSVIYAQIYFPTYSNSLKEIAPYLGFQWSESDASGRTSLSWRSEWEVTGDTQKKQKLIAYNAEDCEALERVANIVAPLCQSKIASTAIISKEVIYTDSLKSGNPYHLGKFVSPMTEFNDINKAAYWDYQRDKIFVKSNPKMKRSLRNRPKIKKDCLRENTVIKVPKPNACPRCSGSHISKYGKFSKSVLDLKYSRDGVKRWIIKHSYNRYICVDCRFTFYPSNRPRTKFGADLIAYIVYHIIDLRVSQSVIERNLSYFFDIQLTRTSLNRHKSDQAKFYTDTYNTLLEKIRTGRLVHADETKATVLGKDGYVWVLTSLEYVAYFYTETREGDTVRDLLKNFGGVLVSDFYPAYDSIECPQQKCLIHLIRDLNDDLYNQPFNEELKSLVRDFALLLKPMIETVDRFGLKAHFLRKHKISVERFYRDLSKQDYKSETAIYYQNRFEKNRGKLFTFLDYDGVPWNNNNAEHAIKSFASLRRVIGGASTEKGIREYLTLLSICETCKYKGIRFLDFLRSGEKDIDTFIQTGKSKAKKTSISK